MCRSTPAVLGYSVKGTEPVHRQVFIGRGPTIRDEAHFERKLFVCRKVVSNRVLEVLGAKARTYYPVSVSARTIVYKGLVLGKDLGAYYQDLEDPRVESAFAMVHQRFSTNTFPSWPLAHPYRFVCHNGEINTVRGNYNWMAARQANMNSDVLGEDLSKLWPISYEGQSDTACFDNALEFLTMGGYSLPHAMMMLIPEAWAGNPLMDEDRRAFYEYHAALMEPWDGPAAMVFTDGKLIGATLDRNGLRPSRYMTLDDGHILLASEMGCLQFAEENITHKWRLQPGKMLLIDLEQKRIISDEELKKQLSTAHPYKEWLKRTQVVLKDLPKAKTKRAPLDGAAARSPAGLRLHPGRPEDPHGADGPDRPGSRGLHGQRRADLGAVRPPEDARHLFQAELRAGDQPADRPDPRGTGHVAGVLHRPAPQPARSQGHVEPHAAGSVAADPHQRGAGAHPHHRRGGRQPVPHRHHRHHL